MIFKKMQFVLLLSLFFSGLGYASSLPTSQTTAPQPTTCITSQFTQTGDFWKSVTLKLTNNCGQPVNFQNASITFNSSSELNTSFWGDFSELSPPINDLKIVSQPSEQGYLNSLFLKFSEESWANKNLGKGKSISIQFGAPQVGYDASSVKVYLGVQPVEGGSIKLSNTTLQPAGVSDAPKVNINSTNGLVKTVQVPWQGSFTVEQLAPAQYSISPENVSSSTGVTYQGIANPKTVTVTANKTVSSNISYSAVTQPGKIKISMPALPAQLSGYTGKPIITLTRPDTGATVTQEAAWQNITTVNSLQNNISYNFSTPSITYNGYACLATFNPKSAIASNNDGSIPTTTVSFACSPIAKDKIIVNVKGAPVDTQAVDVIFTSNTKNAPITTHVTLNGGSGSNTVYLGDNIRYQVSSTAISGYTAAFTPQPIIPQEGPTSQVEEITYRIAPPPGIFYSPYKDITINMDWNTHIISTKISGQLTSLLSQLLPGNKTVTLAFASGECGSESWGGVTPADLMGANRAAFEAENVDYIISTGGAAGIFTCHSVEGMKSFIDRYASRNLAGIDFDVESDSGQLPELMQVMAQTQQQYFPNLRVSLTLATLAAPGATLNPTGDKLVRAAQAAGLNFVVNLMVMDYGLPGPYICQVKDGLCDMGASAVFAAKEFSRMYNIPLNRIELTPMIGDNDARDETTSFQDASTIATFVRTNNLAGLHFWSFDRDVGCNPKTSWASPVCNNASDPNQPSQFNKVFLAALGIH